MFGTEYVCLFVCLFAGGCLGQSRSKTETFDSSACGSQLSSTTPKLGEINIEKHYNLPLPISCSYMEDAIAT